MDNEMDVENPPYTPKSGTHISLFRNDERPLISHHIDRLQANSSELILEHLNKVAVRIRAHDLLFLHYRKVRQLLGYPQIVLSGFLTSVLSVQAFAFTNMSVVAQYVEFLMAAVVFFLNLTSQYFHLAEKEADHDLNAKLYTTLLRSTQIRLMKANIVEQERGEIFRDLVAQMNVIEQFELPIPPAYTRQAESNPESIYILKIDELRAVPRL